LARRELSEASSETQRIGIEHTITIENPPSSDAFRQPELPLA